MFLGVFRRNRKPEFSSALSPNIAALKKLVAVSDEHWLALYEPIIGLATRCFKCFKNNQAGLASDYILQLTNAVRRSKGEVREDQLISHVYTYGLVLSLSSLYLSRLLSPYEFVLQYDVGDRKGERRDFYPWLDLPSSGASIKVRKKRHVEPFFSLALPLYRGLVTEIAARWLQANSEVNIAALQAIYSNGEQGIYSVPLSYLKEYSFDSEQVELPDSSMLSKTSFELASAPASADHAIDSLLDSFGVDLADTTLEDLFNSTASPAPITAQHKAPEQVMPVKQERELPGKSVNSKVDVIDEVDEFAALLAGGNSAIGNLPATSEELDVATNIDDFSVLLTGENSVVVTSSATSSGIETATDIDEFSALLAGNCVEENRAIASNVDSSSKKPDMASSGLEHISDDLIEWAISSQNRSAGVFGVQIEDVKLLALQVPEAFYDYIDSEYSIESTQRDLVLEQLRHDLDLSGNVIANVGDSPTFLVNINGSEVTALIINQVFPRAVLGEVCINKEPA